MCILGHVTLKEAILRCLETVKNVFVSVKSSQGKDKEENWAY